MKTLWFISYVFLFWACVGPEDQKEEMVTADSTMNLSLSPKDSLVDNDTVIVYEEDGDTASYTKKELKEILRAYPALSTEEPLHPDSVYLKGPGPSAGDTINRTNLTFEGEAGHDEFYCLYAYFVRQKSGEKEFEDRRNTLTEIFRIINQIYSDLALGGTYYGHQHTRIVGFVEYAIYRYKCGHHPDYSGGHFEKEKKELMTSLSKKIQARLDDDEVMDGLLTASEKEERSKNLAQQISLLDKLITDEFYLFSASEFIHSNYEE